MNNLNTRFVFWLPVFFIPSLLFAGDAVQSEVTQQPTNIIAITMFLLFVAGTLGITYWAARRTKSTKDF